VPFEGTGAPTPPLIVQSAWMFRDGFRRCRIRRRKRWGRSWSVVRVSVSTAPPRIHDVDRGESDIGDDGDPRRGSDRRRDTRELRVAPHVEIHGVCGTVCGRADAFPPRRRRAPRNGTRSRTEPREARPAGADRLPADGDQITSRASTANVPGTVSGRRSGSCWARLPRLRSRTGPISGALRVGGGNASARPQTVPQDTVYFHVRSDPQLTGVAAPIASSPWVSVIADTLVASSTSWMPRGRRSTRYGTTDQERPISSSADTTPTGIRPGTSRPTGR